MCKVEGCNRKSMYKGQDVCQKHYFRFMRNGTYEVVRKRKIRISNPKGYQLIYMPDHPLSQSSGYVYEHRKVAFEKYGENLPNCEICGKECSWELYTTHIDHIDRDVTNNSPENLRPLCNACNSQRDVDVRDRKGVTSISYMGNELTAYEWARSDFCTVNGHTIKRRLAAGWPVEDAITKPSRTIKGQKNG